MDQNSACIVCSGNRFAPRFGELQECLGCSFLFYPQSHGPEYFKELYGAGYFEDGEYQNYKSEQNATGKNFRRFIRLMSKVRDLSTAKRLLEVGCAYGFFLAELPCELKAIGVDVTDDGPAFARDNLTVDARSGDLLDVDLGADSFDVVCMWDTIEHLGDPVSYFQRIANLTAPGGHLFLTTADLGSKMARLRGGKWRQIHPPTHLWYFSEKTITAFLANVGFDVVTIRHPGYSRSLGNMLHNLGLRIPLPVFLSKLSVYLNLYDIMWVAARKRGCQ